MPNLRRTIAFISGWLAMELLILSAGFLAARGTPSGYFEYFGREHLELALGLWATFMLSLPQFLIGTGLSWSFSRLLSVKSWPLVAMFAIGAASNTVLYLYFATVGVTALIPAVLWQVPSGPWAAWLGLALGFALWFWQPRARSAPSEA